jgi:redox-sensing transcriptional repressor
MVPDKTVGRLSLYRRLLQNLQAEGHTHVFSHELAGLARGTAAQVRRDIMAIGSTGSPARGYEIRQLMDTISAFLDAPQPQKVALVGIGNLGRALMAYFTGRNPKLFIAAAFDTEPQKVDRVISGCRCYPITRLDDVVREEGITIGIITVPASEAQKVASQLCASGVRGLVNYAPVKLHLPPYIYVDDMDMTMSLEKVAYFARQIGVSKEVNS